jgi:catechol 2,3-dioxygenase-like lactoylglutathione lyase family enzyme
MGSAVTLSVHHIALRSRDVRRLEAFYGGVLGLEVVRRDPTRDSVWLRLGNGILMLEKAADAEPAVVPGTRELLAFAGGDRETWRPKLAGAGVPIEEETEHTLYFRDPEGRRLAVSSYPLAG